MKPPDQPDLAWSDTTSRNKGLSSPHCPHANVQRCPRYYRSLSKLEQAGQLKTGMQEFSTTEDYELLKYWQSTDLWQVPSQQQTMVAYDPEDDPDTRPVEYRNFCPQVSFNRFGLFADKLTASLTDDRQSQRCSDVSPMHYSECPLYPQIEAGVGASPLQQAPQQKEIQSSRAEPASEEPAEPPTEASPDKKPRGRPRKFSDDQIAKALHAKEDRKSNKECAKILYGGTRPTERQIKDLPKTLKYRLERDPALREQYPKTAKDYSLT